MSVPRPSESVNARSNSLGERTMTLREIQLFKLGVMEDIASICDKHDIKYILHYGTLLGAIRHEGFIPWDDDVDMAVPWNDYIRLMDVLKQECAEKYYVQNIWTDRKFPLLWTQIRVNGTTSMPVEFCSYDIHWGMCIDVFALIAAETDERKLEKRKRAIRRVKSLLAKEQMALLNRETRGRRQKLINRIPFPIRRMIVGVILKKHAKDPKENGFVSPLQNPRKIYAYDDVLVTEKHVFEGKLFSIPKGYDPVLKTEYGDYMTPPPEEKQGGHEQALGQIINDVHKDYKEYKAELAHRGK